MSTGRFFLICFFCLGTMIVGFHELLRRADVRKHGMPEATYCHSKGGVWVGTRTIDICVKPEALIPL